MKTVNIRTDASVNQVPAVTPFQGAPFDDFANGEEVLIQLINGEGEKVGESEIRSVVKIHDANENEMAWYETYIPANKS